MHRSLTKNISQMTEEGDEENARNNNDDDDKEYGNFIRQNRLAYVFASADIIVHGATEFNWFGK